MRSFHGFFALCNHRRAGRESFAPEKRKARIGGLKSGRIRNAPGKKLDISCFYGIIYRVVRNSVLFRVSRSKCVYREGEFELKPGGSFLRGLRAGIPIGLGYLSVSFTFGIMAVSYGFKWWQAVVISMATVTSAGQLSGIGLMVNPGLYLEMLVSQLVINVRYSFMSISLSQKTEKKFSGIWRWLLGFFITDEIFAVASTEKSVSRSFFAGLAVIPYVGWTFGTAAGALLGNILPDFVMSALCIAIYGMFVAIVVPPVRRERSLLLSVGTALALSCAFYYIPGISKLSSGLAVSICAVAAAVVGALVFPVHDEGEDQ